MPPPADSVHMMPLDLLSPDPTLPRRILVPELTDRLASDLGTHGQLEPLHVRPPIDDTDHFRVIHGRRRLAAMRANGVSSARVIIVDELDDRTVLCRHVAQNQGDPASPLETAWMTGRMVTAEVEAGTAAPQRVVAAWLHAHVGTGSEATVARHMQIARVLTPDWLEEMRIPLESLTRLPQSALFNVAKISGGDERADALRVAAGLLPPPDAPKPAPFEVEDRRGGGWKLSMTEMPSDEWPDQDLAAFIETVEPVVALALSLRDEEPPAVMEARVRAAADWSERIGTLIEALETAHRERDAALRRVERLRTRHVFHITMSVRSAMRWLRRRIGPRTFKLEEASSSLEVGRNPADEG